MKKIVCELCESTDFVKEGGMFVCQGCGTKYTVEEARSMMREVDGIIPVSNGTSVTSAPVGNPNQQQLDNILLLATSAYEADNKAEAENYCNQAIVMDAMCYKAWMLKGKAVGWQSSIDNLRIEEAAHSFCKAIDFAPEEEKEDIKNQAVEEIKSLGLALISLRKERFSGSPDEEELHGFTFDKKALLDALMVLLSHGNAVGMPEGYLEEVANLMNQAGVAALNMARNAWKKLDHPSKEDFDTYLTWNTNIIQVFREAIDTSDDDDEEDIVRYKNLIISLLEPINADAHSEKREWDSYSGNYYWTREYSLSQSAKDGRRKKVEQYKEKIAIIEKKKEEAKLARIKAYWEAHADEKAKLEAEKKELTDRKSKLSAEVADLVKQIDAAQPTGNVSSEDESNKVKAQIKELENRRAGLGVFAGKEKKQISEEIDSLRGRVDFLMDKIEEEKKARVAEADMKTAPLKDKKDELEKQVSAVTKRLSDIEAELTEDPEE